MVIFFMPLPAEQTEEQIPPAPAQAVHDPYAAFRSPAYRVFAMSFVLAVVGQQMISATIQWEIYEATGNLIYMAMIGLVQALPILALALPAGQVADMFPRRRVMLVTQSVVVLGSTALAICALAGVLTPYVIYPILLADSIALTFHRPARASLLPAMVPMRDLASAITWNSTLFETFGVIAPALAGFIIAWSSPAIALLVAALCLAGAMLLTTRLPDHRVAQKREPVTMQTLLAGIRFVFRTRLILAAMSLDLFAVLLGGATILLPVFAKEMGIGAWGYGLLRAATPLGAIIMALLIAHLPPMKRAGRAMLLAVAGFGAATIVFGLSKNIWLSFAMLMLLGMFDNISVVVRHTLVQTLTPDSMRGRVNAVNQIFIGSSNELGAVESATVAYFVGAVRSVVIGGVGTILVVIAVATMFPSMRRLGALRDQKPESET